MSLGNWLGFLGGSTIAQELPELFPLGILQRDFVSIDVMNIYTKILTDVIERCQGLTEDEEVMLWDNCLASETKFGLIHLLAKAMTDKSSLFLVIDRAVGVLRIATASESAQIEADYKAKASSAVGIYVHFGTYNRTDMIKIYSAMEYVTVAGLNKIMSLTKSVQIKINDLRSTVALTDSAEAKAQGVALATALSKGKDIMLDAKDIVATASPDLTAINAALEMLNEKRSFYLGLPCSYITGELNSGLGDTGQADSKAIERGLRSYFVSIIKPTCKALFGKDLTFKTEDFNMLDTGLNTLKTFELSSDEYMSADNKLKVINKLFGFPENTKGGPPAPEPAPVVVPPGPNKVPGAKP